MPLQRPSRWPNIEPTLDQRVVYAENKAIPEQLPSRSTYFLQTKLAVYCPQCVLNIPHKRGKCDWVVITGNMREFEFSV